MLSHTLGAAPTVADAIIDQLSRPSDKAADAGEGGLAGCHELAMKGLINAEQTLVY